jgi:hypothetical protein
VSTHSELQLDRSPHHVPSSRALSRSSLASTRLMCCQPPAKSPPASSPPPPPAVKFENAVMKQDDSTAKLGKSGRGGVGHGSACWRGRQAWAVPAAVAQRTPALA